MRSPPPGTKGLHWTCASNADPGWISVMDAVTLTSIGKSTLTRWCREGYVHSCVIKHCKFLAVGSLKRRLSVRFGSWEKVLEVFDGWQHNPETGRWEARNDVD